MTEDTAFDASPDVLTNNAQGRLKGFIERLDRLQDDAQAVRDDMKEVRTEAKGEGFDTKTINKLVALLRKDKAKVREEKAILDLYACAIGVEDLI
jgi:uncharacterized protein (UPF0335 family)